MAVLSKTHRDDPRREVTRSSFLVATLELLDEGASFADLSISSIAGRAGRTRTAFYAHFEDRRALLLALLERAGGDAIGALGPFLAGKGPIVHADVVTSVRALLGTFARNATLVRAVVEAAGYDTVIAEFWAGVVQQIIDGAQARLVAEGVAVETSWGEATALVWMTERVCYQHAVQGATGLDDDAVVTALSQVWWSALRTVRA